MSDLEDLAETRKAHLLAEQRDHAAWLIGLRLAAQEEDEPDVYAVTLQARNDGWPVMSAGCVLLFTELERAPLVLSMDDDETVRTSVLPPLTLEDTYIYDVNEYVESVLMRDSDDGLVDFLNLLWDWTSALQLDIPETYRSALWTLADHLTFQNDFEDFLRETNVRRSDLADGLFWCMGAIVARSHIVSPVSRTR
jgi:hypothetical protein